MERMGVFGFYQFPHSHFKYILKYEDKIKIIQQLLMEKIHNTTPLTQVFSILVDNSLFSHLRV